VSSELGEYQIDSLLGHQTKHHVVTIWRRIDNIRGGIVDASTGLSSTITN
jgi:hypothetical protein